MYTFSSGTSLLSETSDSSNTLKMNLLMVGMIDRVKLAPISVSNSCPPGVLGTVFVTMYLVAWLPCSRRVLDARRKAMILIIFIIDG